MDSVVLHGATIDLEPLRIDHGSGLLEAAQGGGDRSSFGYTFVPSTAQETETYLSDALAGAAEGHMVPFAIVERSTGTVLGTTRFCRLETWSWPEGHPRQGRSVPDVVEVGYTFLTPTAQRTSVNTEAKLALFSHAFDVWGVLRISLQTDARNAVSQAAIERLGCTREGIRRADRLAPDHAVRDSVTYSMLADEWPAARQALVARLSQSSSVAQLRLSSAS